jgi:Protein of unknown function (DUF3185).
MNKNLGIVLLIIGVVLLVLGMQEYGAFGSSVSRALGRGPSDRAWFLFIGGGACTAFGIMQVFRK